MGLSGVCTAIGTQSERRIFLAFGDNADHNVFSNSGAALYP